MTAVHDVCIRGSGIVGQTLALLLARERLRVALVRPTGVAPTGHSDVRAYALNAASKALIESVRAWPAAEQATAVQHMQVQTEGSGKVHFDANALGVSALTWIADVPALESLLKQAVAFQPLIENVDTPQPATLTVICEGKASQSRQELGVTFATTRYQQSALATRIRGTKPHGQVAHQWIADGEILAFLPLDGSHGNSVAVVWSVKPERALQLQALPSEAFEAELLAASRGVLGDIQLCAERAVWPLMTAQASQWVGSFAGAPGRAWALAGDAAHAVHPLAGQGLNLGLGDVAQLVQVVREREYWRSLGDPKLLRRYERARKSALLTMGSAMDGLQQVLTRPESVVQGLRDWGMQAFDGSGPIKRWVAQRAMGLA